MTPLQLQEKSKRILQKADKLDEARKKTISYKFSLLKKKFSDFTYSIKNLPRTARLKIFDFKCRLVAQFITDHALWWNEHDAKRWEEISKSK